MSSPGPMLLDPGAAEQVAMQMVARASAARQEASSNLAPLLGEDGGVKDAICATQLAHMTLHATKMTARMEILRALLATKDAGVRLALRNTVQLRGSLHAWLIAGEADSQHTLMALVLAVMKDLSLLSLLGPNQVMFIASLRDHGAPAVNEAAAQLLESAQWKRRAAASAAMPSVPPPEAQPQAQLQHQSQRQGGVPRAQGKQQQMSPGMVQRMAALHRIRQAHLRGQQQAAQRTMTPASLSPSSMAPAATAARATPQVQQEPSAHSRSPRAALRFWRPPPEHAYWPGPSPLEPSLPGPVKFEPDVAQSSGDERLAAKRLEEQRRVQLTAPPKMLPFTPLDPAEFEEQNQAMLDSGVLLPAYVKLRR